MAKEKITLSKSDHVRQYLAKKPTASVHQIVEDLAPYRISEALARFAAPLMKAERTVRNLTVVSCYLMFAGLAWAQPSPVAETKPATSDALQAEIKSLMIRSCGWRLVGFAQEPVKN